MWLMFFAACGAGQNEVPDETSVQSMVRR